MIHDDVMSPSLSHASVDRTRFGWLALAERLAWPGALALMLCWAAAYVTWPYSTDQGILAWVGRVIADGGAPYRDAWEIRGPAPFFIYAALADAFGNAQWPLRVVDLAFVAAGAWCIWRTAAMFGHPSAGRFAVVLYVLWFASLSHHDTAQSDGWNAAMIAGVVVAILARAMRPSATHGLIAGVLLGLCVMSKPSYAVFFALPVAIGLFELRRNGWKWLAMFWGAGALGAIVSAAVILVWLRQHDAIAPLIDIHVRWLLTRHIDLEGGWLNRVQTTAAFLTAGKFATALLPAVVGVAALWKPQRQVALLLALWALGAIATVTAQGNFFPYHWHPLYPPLAILAGIGLAAMLAAARATPATAVRAAALGAAAVAVFAAALLPAVRVYRLAAMAAGLLPVERYRSIEFGPFAPHSGIFPRVAEYLREHTAPNETVQIWGSVPGVNVLAERRLPTRFGYVAPLVTHFNDEFRRRYRREYMTSISAAPPRYIVALDDSVCARASDTESRRLIGFAESLMKCLNEMPELQGFVSRGYDPESRLGSFVFYRRRGDLPLAGAVAGH